MPDLWIRDTTGELMWAKQAEIMRAVAVHTRVAVASCNAAGKSHLAARVAVWFMKTFKPAVVLTTAPTDRQVRRILWKEIHSAHNKAKLRGIDLGGELNTKDWQLSPEHYAIGFATRDNDATSFQGIRGPHVLIIADEAAGISESIWEGIFATLKGSHTRLLAIGNPTSIDGRFFQAFQSDRWWTTHISAFDTPNFQGKGIVVPGLVTPEDVEDAKADWGEDSPLYIARVRGRFPDVMENTLITISVCEKAGNGDWTDTEMAETDPDEPVEIGADLARYGSDENVFIGRRGRLAYAWDSFGSAALGRTGVMAAAGRLVQFAEKLGMDRISKIKCDAVGLGGGVPDRLRELQDEGRLPAHIQIIDMNAGAKAERPEKYDDAGTEWWGTLADRMKADMAFGPVFAQKRALAQLTRRKYKYLSKGNIKLESKDEMKKRGLNSPDWGDAIAMAFAEASLPEGTPLPIGVGGSYWRGVRS